MLSNRPKEVTSSAVKIVRRSAHQCLTVFPIVWTKSRLLQCCINVHVFVQSGQNIDNNKNKFNTFEQILNTFKQI